MPINLNTHAINLQNVESLLVHYDNRVAKLRETILSGNVTKLDLRLEFAGVEAVLKLLKEQLRVNSSFL